MSVDEWTEERRDEWYEDTGKADAIAAEIVAAWQQQITEDTAVEWGWVDQDHPARDCIWGAERCSSPGAMFRIEAVAS